MLLLADVVKKKEKMTSKLLKYTTTDKTIWGD